MENKTFLGLDIGTNSIGWAVTNEDFELKTLNGKTAWGSRLFDEANSAKNRRIFRTNKRRVSRRKYRIYLLNKMFEQHITALDESFFIRLSKSNLSDEEPSKEFVNPLFNNKELEKEYYKKYPTIYHLRNALYCDDEYAFSDIRFLYLALHHIIKYRGNFLTEGDIDCSKLDPGIANILNETLNIIYKEILSDEYGEIDDEFYQFIHNDFIKQLTIILLNKNTNKIEKSKEIAMLFDIPSICNKQFKNYITMFSKLIIGSKYDIKSLSNKYSELENSTISFTNSNYDELAHSLAAALNDTFSLVEIAKNIYDFIFLKKLIGDSEIISQSFIKQYDTHKKELKMLKDIILEIDKNKNNKSRLYDKIFKKSKDDDKDSSDNKKDNTCSYSDFVDYNKKIDIEGFNKYIKKILEENKDFIISEKLKANLSDILKKCNDNEFLLKISNVSTSIIPHQLHLNELKKILANAKNHYKFIDDSFIDRAISIFKFKIPYYYGPFNSTGNNSNIVKKEEYKNTLITFDNYKEVIDDTKTKEKFINVRLNYCNYLLNEYTLPRNSFIYTVYVLLDRLNTLKVNGKSLRYKEKIELLDYICSFDNVSLKKIIEYLKNRYSFNSEIVISGINEKDNFVGYPINVFRDIFKTQDEIIKHLKDIEEIIKILTIYKDNLKDGIDVVKNKFSYLNKEAISSLSKLKVSGYGSLSYKLLNGIINPNNKTIIEEMLLTEHNFQQVLQEFLPIIDEYNKKVIGDDFNNKIYLVEEQLENTPSIFRRPIIQALKIIKEVRHFNKGNIDVISLEVTREDLKNKDKKETSEREKIIRDLIKQVSLLKDSNEFVASLKSNSEKVLGELNNLEDKVKLKSKHIYLYFLQLGIDMYSGLPINLNDVMNGTRYDIDHIYPQSKIKDDSLNNTVLVEKEYNQKTKGDKYPVPSSIQERMSSKWLFLKNHKLISDEKYARLTRKEALSDDELNDFVARQLNVVNYVNKRLKSIIEILYGEKTKVIFSKAQYPHELRQQYGIYKIRELNDSHHAVDAYLNIVCGVILNQLFGNLRVIKSIDSNQYDGEKSFNFLKRLLGYISNRNLKERIISNCYRSDFLLTYRQNYGDGAFYDQTIQKHGSGNLNPIHKKGLLSDTTKYGGYSNLATAYYVVGYYTNKKGIKLKSLVRVPNLYIAECTSKNGVINNQLLKEKLLKANEKIEEIDIDKIIYNYTKVDVSNKKYLICSRNEIVCALRNLNQAYLNKDSAYTLYMLLNRYNGKDSIVLNRKGETYNFDEDSIRMVYTNLINQCINNVDDRYTARKYMVKMLENSSTENMESVVCNLKELLSYMCIKSKVVWQPCLGNVLNENVDYVIIENTTGLYSKKIKI